MSKPALAIMARIPSLKGKTRLKSLLTPKQRENLQWSFLLDVLDKAAGLKQFTVFIAAAPPDSSGLLGEIAGSGVEIISQPEGDLGQRMFTVGEQLFDLGYSPVILIGTDIPNLPPAYLARGVKLLKTSQLVLGPALDGGYYLIGLSSPVKAVFEDISWGSDKVLHQTLEYCRKKGISYSLLPCLRDIDLPEDFLALVEEFKTLNPANERYSHRTADFLSTLPLINITKRG